jgi:hypothetical protein
MIADAGRGEPAAAVVRTGTSKRELVSPTGDIRQPSAALSSNR